MSQPIRRAKTIAEVIRPDDVEFEGRSGGTDERVYAALYRLFEKTGENRFKSYRQTGLDVGVRRSTLHRAVGRLEARGLVVVSERGQHGLRETSKSAVWHLAATTPSNELGHSGTGTTSSSLRRGNGFGSCTCPRRNEHKELELEEYRRECPSRQRSYEDEPHTARWCVSRLGGLCDDCLQRVEDRVMSAAGSGDEMYLPDEDRWRTSEAGPSGWRLAREAAGNPGPYTVAEVREMADYGTVSGASRFLQRLARRGYAKKLDDGRYELDFPVEIGEDQGYEEEYLLETLFALRDLAQREGDEERAQHFLTRAEAAWEAMKRRGPARVADTSLHQQQLAQTMAEWDLHSMSKEEYTDLKNEERDVYISPIKPGRRFRGVLPLDEMPDWWKAKNPDKFEHLGEEKVGPHPSLSSDVRVPPRSERQGWRNYD